MHYSTSSHPMANMTDMTNRYTSMLGKKKSLRFTQLTSRLVVLSLGGSFFVFRNSIIKIVSPLV